MCHAPIPEIPEIAMKQTILAGVSAIALAVAGAGLAYAAESTPSNAAGHQAMPSSTSSGSSQAAAQQNAPRAEVQQAQEKLKAEGMYKGQVDGIDGPETKQALEQFQQKNGLKQTGQLDQQTLAKLGVSGGSMSGTSTPPSGTSGSTGGNSHFGPSGQQK
jgi:peptidoglycan hydrolase-like protein with peptidoglycan-binding domain